MVIQSVMSKTPTNRGQTNMSPEGIGFWALVAEDFATHESKLFSQGFWAVFWNRFGNWRMGLPYGVRIPFTLIYRVMHRVTQWTCGIDLPYTVILGRRVKIEHFGGMILIAERIGNDVIIRQNTTLGITGPEAPGERPTIGNGVHLGAGVVIVGAVTVGDGARVGANAVVVKDVPPGGSVGGVPARILGKAPAFDEHRENKHG